MQQLIENIKSIPQEVQLTINNRLAEFSSFSQKPSADWFSELCFCILTANSRAKTALALEKTLQYKGFATLPEQELVKQIISHKHRFHNVKAARIVEARTYLNIKSIIQNLVKEKGEFAAREWLAENIKGLGYKEASHFMRNTGHNSLAILDRHILNLMHHHNMISEIPKPLTKNKYLDIELKFQELSKKLNLSPAHLDLAMWYLKTGEVLK